jgi:hypothetical protein
VVQNIETIRAQSQTSGGYDIVTYNNDPATTSGITVHLAAGTVTGDATVGTDTIRHVEAVRGTNFADTYNAVGYTGAALQGRPAGIAALTPMNIASSTLAGSSGAAGSTRTQRPASAWG